MIVFFAHGSPDARHGEDVADLAHRTGVILGDEVQVAYLEHQGPSLVELAAAVQPGSRVRVLPLLLASGMHSRIDVPSHINKVREIRRDVIWELQPTLPPQTLALAVLDLLASGAAPTAGEPSVKSRAVVGVVAGSTRTGALDGFAPLVQSLRIAQVELVLANGPAELTRAADLAAEVCPSSNIEVVPLMFADGVLVDRARAVAESSGWRVTPPIGKADACAEALANWLWSGVTQDELVALG